MAELLHYALDQGTTIAVEVDDDDTGFAEASPGGLPARAAQTFSAAVAHGRRAAEVAFEQFRRMADPPQEITMEIGLKLSGEAGAVLAKTASEGHIVLTLVWRPAGK
ncbi:CU044_2847 family protein [Actinoplanes sp. NPDC051851]|uniref:CU044_2847 family protein n=1 Tax=Actinoplanes sp. NPDC051851 TaxID=3154753 RepID=UPI003433559C